MQKEASNSEKKGKACVCFFVCLQWSVFKIYEEQTLEVGVYIDRHLYMIMEKVIIL